MAFWLFCGNLVRWLKCVCSMNQYLWSLTLVEAIGCYCCTLLPYFKERVLYLWPAVFCRANVHMVLELVWNLQATAINNFATAGVLCVLQRAVGDFSYIISYAKGRWEDTVSIIMLYSFTILHLKVWCPCSIMDIRGCWMKTYDRMRRLVSSDYIFHFTDSSSMQL